MVSLSMWMYFLFLMAPIFFIPFINYLFLQNVQEDRGKLKGYFLFKSLLVFQPTLIIISLFSLNVWGWKIIYALFPYISEGNLTTICILSVIGLFFILAFIKKQLLKIYCLKLDSHSLLRNIAIDMTKEGFTLIYPIIYFLFYFWTYSPCHAVFIDKF